MTQMMTLIRREVIENRSSWAVPAAFGALFVVAALLAVFGLVQFGMMDRSMTLAEIGHELDATSIYPALLVMFMPIMVVLVLVMTFVVFFYFLDALYAERKDRSILFWKSLPVSDLQVVGSKYLTGIVAIPLLTVGVFLVTAVLVWLIGGFTLLWAGSGAALAGGPAAMLNAMAIMVYVLLTQALWLAPVHAWLLLVSAFAKRAVLGWVVAPPALLVVAEKILLGTRHFADMIGHRMIGGFQLAFSNAHSQHAIFMESDGAIVSAFPPLGDFLTPVRFLASPSLWIGIAVGVLFLAGAVWLRRWRDES
jgi:ABC-2 type transport system permease protein